MINNGPAPARFDRHGKPLSDGRATVLELVQQAQAPVSVADAGRALNVHDNTARNHLDALVSRGLLAKQRRAAEGRGRPGWEYVALAQGEPDPRVRDYIGLASALAAHISRTSAHPREDAIAAGEAWGETLASGVPAKGQRHARAQVVALLDGLGFAPEADSAVATVRLRRCPLLDAAHDNPEVICGVHHGIVRGAMSALNADASPVALLPFAEPGACVLHLAGSSHRSSTDKELS